jgi:hypothetical protein
MPKNVDQFVNGKLIRDVCGKTSVDIYEYINVYAKTTYDNISGYQWWVPICSITKG